jgi:hypothetical protein
MPQKRGTIYAARDTYPLRLSLPSKSRNPQLQPAIADAGNTPLDPLGDNRVQRRSQNRVLCKRPESAFRMAGWIPAFPPACGPPVRPGHHPPRIGPPALGLLHAAPAADFQVAICAGRFRRRCRIGLEWTAHSGGEITLRVNPVRRSGGAEGIDQLCVASGSLRRGEKPVPGDRAMPPPLGDDPLVPAIRLLEN